jgi:tetratricopeptide (TPR) repeat protein
VGFRRNVISLLILLLILAFQPVNAQLNKAYFLNQARYHLSNNQNTQAISVVNQLIKTDSTIAEAWLLRGVAKYNLNDVRGSITDFSAAIRFNPVFTLAYLYRGSAYSQVMRLNLAIADYNSAIDLRPSSIDAYFNRGIAYMLQQQFGKAQNDFSRVIVLDSRNTDAWINRGTAKLYASDTLGAIIDYNQAIILKPFYSEAYGKRGRIRFEMKQFDKALFDFNQTIKLDTMASVYYFFRGLTHNALGNEKMALFDFNKTLEINPNNPLSLFNRALLHWKLQNMNQALSDFDLANNLNPNNILIHYNRAILKMELKKYSSAIDDLTKALDLLPNFTRAYLARAEAHFNNGNIRQSEIDYDKAKSLSSNYLSNADNQWSDTTHNFKQLVTLGSDFSFLSGNSLLNNLDENAVDFLPFQRVIAVLRDHPMNDQSPVPFIDSLNSVIKNESFYFMLSNRKGIIVDTNLYKGNNKFIKKLLVAQQLGSSKRYRETIDFYKDMLIDSPSNPAILINLSAEMTEMANFIASFEEDLKPQVMGTQVTSVKKQSRLAQVGIIAFEEPLEILTELLIKYPNQSALYFNIGNIYSIAGDFELALHNYSKAINISPSIPEGWYNRGFVYLMLKKTNDACYDLGKAGELGLPQAYAIIARFCKK